jgi:hypothetical protein
MENWLQFFVIIFHEDDILTLFLGSHPAVLLHSCLHMLNQFDLFLNDGCLELLTVCAKFVSIQRFITPFQSKFKSSSQRILNSIEGKAICSLPQEVTKSAEYRNEFLSAFVHYCVKIVPSFPNGKT